MVLRALLVLSVSISTSGEHMPKRAPKGDLAGQQLEAETAYVQHDVTTPTTETATTTKGTPNTMTQAQGTQDTGNLDDLFFIDMENVKEPPQIVPGRYNAVIKNAKPSRSKAGNGVMTVQWTLTDNEGEAAQFNGRTVFDPVTWSDNTMQRVKAFLQAIGIDPSFKGAPTPDMLIGERATLTLTIRPGSGINEATGEKWPDRPNVAAYLPYGSSEDLASILGG